MSEHAPVGTLEGWTRSPFTGGGLTYDVYRRGSGPGVVLIPEIPGITPEVLGLAEHLVLSGFTVAVPSPFGTPGRPASAGYTVGTVARLCVASEFRAFAVGASRPITGFLRALAADLADRTPGNGAGVIGMCFTGGFALATAVDGSVTAAVASQPAAPFPVSRRHRADPTMSPAEFDQVAERAARGDVCALGLRFSHDGSVPAERFRTLSDRLGDAFRVIEIDSGPGNPGGFSRAAHSVLTSEVRERPGHPARQARDEVVAFLRERLDPDGVADR
ncbi:dienelactone hydrolase family protein [Kineosporia sp. J2-2]|uniref:Dienelactone hydrolase family protein n=1 Tax=Kineosporia corallincola TaxID=2835133 RepID=A0ABS5TGL8_9ACTN|nr:dienelactone hydrolase family protein [Kineosporia corallincola]MBT0768744.1 dienelactone hydrolase family protein [Kineosporia corallincola]